MLAGNISQDADGERIADLRIDLPTIDAPRLHELIPRKVLPKRGEAWCRDVLTGGDIRDGLAVIRGPLAAVSIPQQ